MAELDFMRDKVVNYCFIKIDGTKKELQTKSNGFSAECRKQRESPKTCAYIMENVNEEKTYYFIRHRGGHLFDTFRADDRGYARMEWKYKKVSKDIMITYMKYIGGLESFKKMKGKKFLLSQAENLLN